MKRAPNRIPATLLAMAAGLFIGLAPSARADDDHRDRGRRCSNASLKGTYGFYRTGMTAVGPLAAVGILTFDGRGNTVSRQTISRNGELEFDVEFPSFYEVAEDCTGRGVNEEGIETSRFVIVDGGKGFYILSLTPGNAVYGVGTAIGGR